MEMSSTAGQPDEGSKESRRKFKSATHGLLAILRAQACSEVGMSQDFRSADVVARIATTLVSTETCRQVLTNLFNEYSTPAEGCQNGGRQEPMLNLKFLAQIYEHWMIPSELIHLFWSLWRKLKRAWVDQVMPQCIDFYDFQTVMVKVLRRVRHLYCGHKLKKGSFVLQNRSSFEDEYATSIACGSGSFGDCFWVTHRLSKRKRVCKRLPKEDIWIPPEEVPAEFRILQDLDHPHIVKIFECFEEPTHYMLILEPAYGGDLKHLLAEAQSDSRHSGLQEDVVREIARQTLQALKYIHSRHVIHGDVKPANMLLTKPIDDNPEEVHVLLADFGIADFFPQDMKICKPGVKGTFAYMAIEVFMSMQSPSSDVWSLGIVSCELLCGQRPYKAEHSFQMFATLRKSDPSFQMLLDANTSEAAVAFVKRLLVKEQVNRPTVDEALSDAWIATPQAAATPVFSRRQNRKLQKSLSAFLNTGHFARVALNCVASQLNTAEVERLARVFEDMDTDHNGTLSTDELANGLKRLGANYNDVNHIQDLMDINCDGVIEYSEFVACLLTAQGKLVDDIAYNAFHVFDVNHNGTISVDELRLMLSGDGPLVAVLPDGKTVQQVLAEIDTSGDGVISFAEFKEYIQRESQGPLPTAYPSGTVSPQQEQLQTLDAPVAGADAHQDSIHMDLKSNGAAQSNGLEVNGSETLENLLRRCAPVLGRSEEEVLSWARYLAERHWLKTVQDLSRFSDREWLRLDLPLKLECVLRDYIGTGEIEKIRAEEPMSNSTSIEQAISVEKQLRREVGLKPDPSCDPRRPELLRDVARHTQTSYGALGKTNAPAMAKLASVAAPCTPDTPSTVRPAMPIYMPSSAPKLSGGYPQGRPSQPQSGLQGGCLSAKPVSLSRSATPKTVYHVEQRSPALPLRRCSVHVRQDIAGEQR